MKNIFITGSCGFLFSNFIRKVIYYKLDYKISSLDVISNSHILNNVFENKNHSFYIGSCADKHLLNIIFLSEKPDVIVHGAFDSNSIENNFMQTFSLLEKCKEHNIKKFVYISSDEVYGSNKEICFNELSVLNAINNLSLSKINCEELVKNYCKLNNISYCIVRCSNFFGPRQNKKNIFVDSIYKFKNNQTVTLENFGKNTRDYGYVVDAVNGILKILENWKNNETYNLTRGFELTELDILNEISEIMGSDKSLIKVNSNSNDYIRIISTNHKLKSLGWEPEVSLKDGLKNFVQWYLNNNWWFND